MGWDYQDKYDGDYLRSKNDPKKKADRAVKAVEARRLSKVKITLPRFSIQRDEAIK